ncbi:MAG: transcription elongation factor GreA, partial [Myxococcota bacterium]
RIREVEGKLSRAQVIDTSKLSGDRVVFGAKVTILLYERDEEQTWTIVGDDEASPDQGRIGVSSPIARALIGREVGDEVKIKAPGGVREAEVLSVSFS